MVIQWWKNFERWVMFFDKKNYVGSEKIMILTNKTGQGDKRDKV